MRPAASALDQGQREQHAQRQRRHDRETRRRACQSEHRHVAEQRPRPRDVGVRAGDVHERTERQQCEADGERDPSRRAEPQPPDSEDDDGERDQTQRRRVLDEHARRCLLRRSGEPDDQRVRRVRLHERQQVDARRAAAPVDRRRHPGAVHHPLRRAVERRRQHDRAGHAGGDGGADGAHGRQRDARHVGAERQQHAARGRAA